MIVSVFDNFLFMFNCLLHQFKEYHFVCKVMTVRQYIKMYFQRKLGNKSCFLLCLVDVCHVQTDSGCSGSESSLSSRRNNRWIFVLRDLYQSASAVNETQTAEAVCLSLLDRVSMHCCVICVIFVDISATCCLDWLYFHITYRNLLSCSRSHSHICHIRDSLFTWTSLKC